MPHANYVYNMTLYDQRTYLWVHYRCGYWWSYLSLGYTIQLGTGAKPSSLAFCNWRQTLPYPSSPKQLLIEISKFTSVSRAREIEGLQCEIIELWSERANSVYRLFQKSKPNAVISANYPIKITALQFPVEKVDYIWSWQFIERLRLGSSCRSFTIHVIANHPSFLCHCARHCLEFVRPY